MGAGVHNVPPGAPDHAQRCFDAHRPRPATIVRESTTRGYQEDLMRISETKHTGGCTCRCNACKNGAHCKNIGSGCRVKL